MAIIDRSILYAVGEIFGFAALWAVLRAIDKGGVAKIRHGNTSLEVKNEKKPDKIDEPKIINLDNPL